MDKEIEKTDEQILAENNDKRTETLNYTRVMGYTRPVSSFNTGKQGEYNERVFFTEGNCSCCCDK